MTQKHFKHIIILAIVMVASINTYAVPAKRVWRTVTLTDGTQVEAMLIGDEHGHWFVDRNGKAIGLEENGKAFYMTDAQLAERKEHRKERAYKANAQRVTKIAKTRALSAQSTSTSGARKTFGKPTSITGTKKGLVILVNFSDKSFKSTNNQTLFNRRFNEQGYNETGCVGSVHDYFYDQSYGKFNLSFDVIGPVTVSKTHDYYGSNDKDGDDKYAAAMVIEAIKLVDSQVNFKDYDWDGDGEVDQVFVIYAGTGENSSNTETDIWPHEYNLTEAKAYGDGTGAMTLDGVKIDTYACSCELSSSSTVDGIGTACHEFSHCLGYADLYDIDYSGGQGMMYWDLLDAGSYNGPNTDGEVPAPFTSFERWWAGWMDLTVLDKPQYINNMPALTDEAVAYKIVNEAHPDEYYLLENHQAKKWDLYTAGDGDGTGHGLLILHVDYDESVWQGNGPNDNKSRQRMTYFPADNSYGTTTTSGTQTYWSATFADSAGDPFPGTKKKTSFTNTTTPASTLYNANTDGTKYMNKPVTDIAESNGLISFTFMGGKAMPTVQSAVATSSSSFTASWTAVDDVVSYSVRAIPYVEKTSSQSLLLNETFSKVSKTSTNKIDSYIDIYTDNTGWKANLVYPDYTNNVKSLKIGNSQTSGYIVTPSLTPTSDYVTVAVNSMQYKTDKNSLTVSLCDNNLNQKTIDAVTSGAYSAGFNTFTTSVLNISASANPCRIAFIPYKRVYISSIQVYDGKFTANEISSGAAAKALIATKTASDDTITISGLTDTKYTFTGLTADKYQFQVKAVYNDGTESTWTNPVTVSMDVTSIIDVLDTPKTDDNRIFNINGQYVGTDFNTLPRGIYIRGGRKIIKR